MNLIQAILTGSFAILAAVLAQILNNTLAVRRERVNYYKAIHSELISKYLGLLVKNAYLYHKPLDENHPQILHDAMIGMERDLNYFSPTLQAKYSIYSVNRLLEDASSDIEKRLEFELSFHFLQYSKEVFRESHIETNQNYIDMLDHVAASYAYLAIATELQGYETASNNLVCLNRFSMGILNVYTLEEYDSMLKKSENHLGEILVE